MPIGVVDFNEAVEIVRTQVSASGARRPPVERVDLPSASGRVLAADLRATRDQPAFHRSTRDGFAVRAAEVRGGARLVQAGALRAGERWTGAALLPGQAIEIMTGAPVPDGADAVLMIEHCTINGTEVGIAEGRRLEAGENVVQRGSEARSGDALLRSGTRLGAAEIALAASCGQGDLAVFARPSVSILATGDELVELGEAPELWQIWNSNGYALGALVTEAGGHPTRLPIARDNHDEIRDRVNEGRGADLLLLSGGVSMGKYDLVEEVLGELGAEFFFTGVRMQPGKPVVFGKLPARDGERECLFFGLPGNPVSTEVTFRCFAQPLLHVLGGGAWEGPRFLQATLAEDVMGKPGLTRLLPARLNSQPARPEVRLVGWQGSGDLHANARANIYAVLPGDTAQFRSGDVISVLLR